MLRRQSCYRDGHVFFTGVDHGGFKFKDFEAVFSGKLFDKKLVLQQSFKQTLCLNADRTPGSSLNRGISEFCKSFVTEPQFLQYQIEFHSIEL